MDLYEWEYMDQDVKKEEHVKKWIHNYFNPESSIKVSS